jgi:hypothetical protein
MSQEMLIEATYDSLTGRIPFFPKGGPEVIKN